MTRYGLAVAFMISASANHQSTFALTAPSGTYQPQAICPRRRPSSLQSAQINSQIDNGAILARPMAGDDVAPAIAVARRTPASGKEKTRSILSGLLPDHHECAQSAGRLNISSVRLATKLPGNGLRWEPLRKKAPLVIVAAGTVIIARSIVFTVTHSFRE